MFIGKHMFIHIKLYQNKLGFAYRIVVNRAKNTAVSPMNVMNRIIVINQKEPRKNGKTVRHFCRG